MFVKPTVQDFKDLFYRDFPFQPTPDPLADPPIVIDINKYIQDLDITNAFKKADAKFNEAFFCEQEEYSMGYLYLAAHMLVMSIRASNGGISGSFSWGATSTSVGSVSQSNQLPGLISTNPLWAWLVSTPYGVEYLMMIIPHLVGNFGIAPGRTLP